MWICFCHCFKALCESMSMIEMSITTFFEKWTHFIRAQVKKANAFSKAKALATLICVPFDMIVKKKLKVMKTIGAKNTRKVVFLKQYVEWKAD